MADKKEDGSEGEPAAASRGEWGGQLEFILTCIGYAVGLGNVWRFPYMVYTNGGGAFLIPYFIMLFLVGLPIFFLELAFGQFASLGPTKVWTISPVFKGLGFAMVITNMTVALYYCVIISWALYYLFASMQSPLPWSSCGNWYNTKYCIDSETLANFTGQENVTIANETFTRYQIKSPAEEYYYHQVLRISSGIDETGSIVWQLMLCLLLCWVIVFFVLIRGISSLGKVVYFTSTFPYILLTIMLIRGVTLEGAATGIEYYLRPQWEKLAEIQVWSDAASQIFYNLSACTGGLIAMASYNKFKNNCLRDSIIVPIVNAFTSLYAGFVVFSVLGFMAVQKGVGVEDVAVGGPGLVFVVYPEALSVMPVAPLWSILFFLMLLSLGFSSEFSMVETFYASITDEFPNYLQGNAVRQLIMRSLGTLAFFCISIPMVTQAGYYWFSLIDYYIGGFPLLIIGFCETTVLCYVYGFKRFSEDIALMLGKKPNLYFKITWMGVAPIVLGGIVVILAAAYTELAIGVPFGTGLYTYPAWATAIGWCVVVLPLMWIPIVFLIKYMQLGGYLVLKVSSSPTPEWHPALPENRMGRYKLQDEARKKSEAENVKVRRRVSAIDTPLSNSPSNGSALYLVSEKPSSNDNPGFDSYNETL